MNKLIFLRGEYPLFVLFAASFAIAFLSHLFFIAEWFNGRYMTGINDGLSQMLPFKKLLYEQYKNGELFYSPDFGFGGGTYTQLGYYFSTSIVFLITAAVTFLLESMRIIGRPDIFYWADAILVISVLRMTVILMVTTFFFRYLKLEAIPAFCGAVVYSTSIIYFRHVTYWEFFADAMLWLPLLLIGAEKIIREGKAGIFLAAVSISMFDNFYFAYVNFLLIGLYILFRWLFPLAEGETQKGKQIKLYLASLITGFCISGVSFFPAVYGYLNNYRPPYEDAVPLFDFVDNILLNGRVVYLPAFVLVSLMLVSFYQNRLFRFFAAFTIVLTTLHFSPIVGSIFNGFSAPQYRWEYMLSLTAGGVTAAALTMLDKIKMRQLIVASAIAAGLYFLFYFFDQRLAFKKISDAYMVIAAGVIIVILWVLVLKRHRTAGKIAAVLMILSSMYIANSFQNVRLTNTGTEYRVSREYMMSDQYNEADQQKLIRLLQKRENDPLARIDWMIDLRNNTAIVQDFKGMSVYSSILNKDILLFYLKDLEIDMGRESVSRYASLGDRANLYSILMGKYYVAKRGDEAIPYGFKEFAASGDYIAYKNEYMLPFVRPANTVFLEKDLKNTSPVAKEHAMLTGIVLEKGSSDVSIPLSRNLIGSMSIEPVNASYDKGILKVEEEEGGLDLIPRSPNPAAKDYYVKFYIDGIKNKEEFILQVNKFFTTRKEEGSIYRTNVNEIVIRVKAEDRISLRVPKGKYKLKDFKLYEETYEVLNSVTAKSSPNSLEQVNWSGNRLSFTYQNEANDQYAAIPLPYEKGWRLMVNGEKQEILKANYAFTGIRLQEGKNEVKLVYYPPFFFQLLFLSISSICIVLFIFMRKKAIPRSWR